MKRRKNHEEGPSKRGSYSALEAAVRRVPFRWDSDIRGNQSQVIATGSWVGYAFDMS